MQIFQQLIFLHSTLTIRSDVASKLLLLLLLRAVFIVDNCRLCCLQFIRSFYFDRLLYSSSTYSLILVPFISYYCCCHFSSIDLPIALWVVSASFARFDHIIYDCLWARSIVCIRCCCWCLSSPRIYVSGTLLLPFVVLMHMCIAAAVPSIQLFAWLLFVRSLRSVFLYFTSVRFRAYGDVYWRCRRCHSNVLVFVDWWLRSF